MNDRKQLIRDGYLNRRKMIDESQLADLRQGAELMVKATQAEASAERMLREPQGGHWDYSPQPRTGFGPLMDDPLIARLLEFALGEKTLDYSAHLFQSPQAVPGFFSIFQILCNAEHADYGPADWHRDVVPVSFPPLDVIFEDIRANGPHYVQWNIALYDDSMLWVVPGSHLRRNTAEENAAVLEHPDRPLPGAVQADLKAGDGVTYIAPILHWGSFYGRKRRRTLHCGYRPIGGKSYRPHNGYVAGAINTFEEAKVLPHVAPWARDKIEQIQQNWSVERDTVEKVFRAILAKDASAFCTRLVELHPGQQGRMATVIFLLKFLDRFVSFKRVGKAGGRPLHPESLVLRFSEDELNTLQDRFAVLNEKLQYDQVGSEPLFQARTSKYRFYEMPQGFGIDEFVASWNGKA